MQCAYFVPGRRCDHNSQWVLRRDGDPNYTAYRAVCSKHVVPMARILVKAYLWRLKLEPFPYD